MTFPCWPGCWPRPTPPSTPSGGARRRHHGSAYVARARHLTPGAEAGRDAHAAARPRDRAPRPDFAGRLPTSPAARGVRGGPEGCGVEPRGAKSSRGVRSRARGAKSSEGCEVERRVRGRAEGAKSSGAGRVAGPRSTSPDFARRNPTSHAAGGVRSRVGGCAVEPRGAKSSRRGRRQATLAGPRSTSPHLAPRNPTSHAASRVRSRAEGCEVESVGAQSSRWVRSRVGGGAGKRHGRALGAHRRTSYLAPRNPTSHAAGGVRSRAEGCEVKPKSA
jgi:hypothetical protein